MFIANPYLIRRTSRQRVPIYGQFRTIPIIIWVLNTLKVEFKIATTNLILKGSPVKENGKLKKLIIASTLKIDNSLK